MTKKIRHSQANETTAMTFLAGQLEGTKRFSFERAEDALREVIEESSAAPVDRVSWTRACVAAALAVRFHDEYKKSCEDKKSRQGYKTLLRRLHRTAVEETFRWNPRGTVVTRMFPSAAAAFTTPRLVREAEAVASLRDVARDHKKKPPHPRRGLNDPPARPAPRWCRAGLRVVFVFS